VHAQTENAAVAIAEFYAYRGEIAQALTWLDCAYEQQDGRLVPVKGDPLEQNRERERS
jgi:hypothetical protein